MRTHGHVTPNEDGSRARCGGPKLCSVCALEFARLHAEPITKQHGVHCPKVEHLGNGYLHGASDDSPYDVDGVIYCGRCHGWMG